MANDNSSIAHPDRVAADILIAALTSQNLSITPPEPAEAAKKIAEAYHVIRAAVRQPQTTT